jgi:hypothetical protein
MTLGARCSVEDVKKFILLPLQKALEILSPRPNYARLVLTLGKIVTVNSWAAQIAHF